MNRIYLDYAAGTPVDRQVLRAMEPYFTERFGNPGSLHAFGQDAIAAVDRSRETVAQALGTGFRNVIFTGSATEANNLALRGSIRGLTQTARRQTQTNDSRVSPRGVRVDLRPKVIVSAIEHESVLETARGLEEDGVEVVVLPVDQDGIVNIKKLRQALDDRTAVVSVMYVNNEIGTIEPIAKIADIVREARGGGRYPLLHTDAAQAFCYFSCAVDELGVDLMTLSGQKMFGPKGIGALYMRRDAKNMRTHANDTNTSSRHSHGFALSSHRLEGLMTGGGQEFGLRSGTENVPAIVGFAEAVRLADKARQKERARLQALIARTWSGMKRAAPSARVNGVPPSDTKRRTPHILNVHIPAMSAEELLTRLDMLGVAVSSGSACAARSLEPSHVIRALGHTGDRARQSIRVSFGRQTTNTDITKFLTTLRTSLKKIVR